MNGIEMNIIARIHTDFPEKFGIPRQSGLVTGLPARIVFEKEYRRPEAVRGLEGFTHLWLIWYFSENGRRGAGHGGAEGQGWSATVRPPRLGGNRRVGVFATRSPFRPNPVGLSAVRLLGVELEGPEAPVLIVDGADLMDGTPIFDIKPYLPFADSIPDAADGFAGDVKENRLRVEIPDDVRVQLERILPPEKLKALAELLAQSPVPGYKDDAERVYGLSFAGTEVKFKIEGGVLTVLGAEAENPR